MWTATIDTATKEGSAAKIQVTYASDTEEIRESYNLDSTDFLKQIIVNKLAQLEARDEGLTKIVPGPVEIVDEPDPVKPTPTPQAILDFLADVAFLKRMLIAINLGIKTTKDADYLALLSKIIQEFNSSYINYL